MDSIPSPSSLTNRPSLIMSLNKLYRCINGPRLFYHYPNKPYCAHRLESIMDIVVRTLGIMAHGMLYILPLWLPILIVKSILFPLDLQNSLLMFCSMLLLDLIAIILRGWSRFNNNDYCQFIDTLYHCQLHWNEDTETLQTAIRQYDFSCKQDPSPWPIGYRWNRSRLFKELGRTTPSKLNFSTPPRSRPNTYAGQLAPTPHRVKQDVTNGSLVTSPKPLGFDLKSFVLKLVGMLLERTVLCWITFPVCIEPLRWFYERHIVSHRARLINNFSGQRTRLLAKDGNTIDTIFVDRRIGGEDASKSHYLLICCDSRSYIETDLMLTALDAGYSTLGYNAPGCGESTGRPTIEEQLNAIDVVIHYACDRLKFKFGRILLVASSNGCLAATWTAKNYPEIRGLFLHNVLSVLPPLISKLPSSFRSPITDIMKQKYVMPITDNLKEFQGPVLFMGEGKEAIFSMGNQPLDILPPNALPRKNTDLLRVLLRTRFPLLFKDSKDAETVINKWFSCDEHQQRALLQRLKIESPECEDAIVASFNGADSKKPYPLLLGAGSSEKEKVQIVLLLTSKHWKECSPCVTSFGKTPVPLSADVLSVLPWDIREFAAQKQRFKSASKMFSDL